MPIPQIVFFFVIIGAMRVVQKVCSKKVSSQIDGSTYFHYGGYYQLLSAVFSLILLLVVGFQGLKDAATMKLYVAYAAGTAVFMAIELFTEIEALKGSSLIVGQMFQAGALFIPCLFGNFFIEGQGMGVWQWLGLCVFMVAMYLMISQKRTKNEDVSEEKSKQKISLKTLIMLILMMLGGGGTMVVQNAFGNLMKDGDTAMYSFLMFAINALVLYICYLVQALFFQKPNAIQAQPQTMKKEPKLKFLPKVLLMCGAFLAVALFAINYLVTELTSVVAPSLLFSLSSAIAIIVTMLVGRFVYGEKMSFRNVVGIVLCAGSLAMISFL